MPEDCTYGSVLASVWAKKSTHGSAPRNGLVGNSAVTVVRSSPIGYEHSRGVLIDDVAIDNEDNECCV